MPSNKEKSSLAKTLDFHSPNLMKEKDYISELPDSIIHHILSFLPSTEEAIRTGVLSKRWRYQWTHVPVLVFDMHCYNFSVIVNIISLYQCLRIKKFECCNTEYGERHLRLVTKFATKRRVELILQEHHCWWGHLPRLLFKNASPVRLKLCRYDFKPNERVEWGFLKVLELEECYLSNQGIENALSGSPLLETLKLTNCRWHDPLFIASKSLQELILRENDSLVTQILCPNLQKFMCTHGKLCGRVIRDISSGFPLLKSLKLRDCGFFGLEQLTIASKSLKRLVLGHVSSYNDDDDNEIEISRKLKLSEILCPKLEELVLFDCSDVLRCAVMNVPSLVYATLCNSGSVVENTLQQLQLSKGLSNAELACLSPPLLNKSLILEMRCLDEQHCGIAWALQNFHVLEKLTVKLPACENYNRLDLNELGENYWDSCVYCFQLLGVESKDCEDHGPTLGEK